VAGLISIDEARARVLAAVRPLSAEEVCLDAAAGRILAEDVTSAFDVPPFAGSAMDGYALAAGPEAELEVIGESRAGRPADVAVRAGTAIRISTGAALPEGADAVVPLERATVLDRVPPGDPKQDSGRVRVPATTPGEHVRRAGEDVRAGSVVLSAGTTLEPAALGVAAAVGRSTLRCARRPRVALIVTGDELTEPGEPLPPGGIYSSNAFALAAQVERAGGELVERHTVPDSAAPTRQALERGLAAADLVIASGGISVGPHDHVKPALRELGVEEHFWGVSLRPGKPTWFGTSVDTLVFGLPGNPVSAMVTFELFVRPALRALQGAPAAPLRATAILEEPVRRNPSREQAIRVRLQHTDNGLRATTTGPQGSHVLTSMLGAQGLARIGAGAGELAAGERVEVELL
jgi:molybdopterin molybdotransferase